MKTNKYRMIIHRSQMIRISGLLTLLLLISLNFCSSAVLSPLAMTRSPLNVAKQSTLSTRVSSSRPFLKSSAPALKSLSAPRLKSSLSSDNTPSLYLSNNDPLVNAVMEHNYNEFKVLTHGRINELFDGRRPLDWAILFQNQIMVNHLLHENVDLNYVDEFRQSPLILAIRAGLWTQVLKMLDFPTVNVAIIDKEGKNALLWALQEGAVTFVIEKLLLKGAWPSTLTEESEETPLNLAIKLGRLDAVELFVQKGARINPYDNNCATPLELAIEYKRLLIASLLIKSGANVNHQWKGGLGETPLLKAVRSEMGSIVIQLIEKGADVEKKDIWDRTPLLVAADVGDLAIFGILLKSGAQLNSKDDGGQTALMIACEKNRFYIVELLLKMNVDLNEKDNQGRTAEMFASKNGNQKIVKLLRSKSK